MVLSYRFDQHENIGIFTFYGDVSKRQLTDLKEKLMRSIARLDSLVLNFQRDISMDRHIREVLSSAYRMAKRLRKPIIFNGSQLDRHFYNDSEITL